jgi:hypothetical protein
MPNQLPGFVVDILAECHGKGITDIREILDQIPEHIAVDDGCLEKYKDILSATNAENIE